MTISRRKFMLGAGVSAIAAPGIGNLLSPNRGEESHIARGQSLWTTAVPAQTRYTRYAGEQRADLVIVGGGYTGLSCAFYVKKFRPDWRVIVLEAQQLGSGASSRNSGAVYAKYEGINDLGFTQRGLQRLNDFIGEQNIDCDFHSASTLFTHYSKRSADKAKSLLKQGENWLSADQLTQLAGTSYYAGATQAQGYFKLDPVKLLMGQIAAANSVGVELYENSAVTEIDHARPAKVSTKRGVVMADNVLIATNGFTPRLGILNHSMYPLHQFTLATRVLSAAEIAMLGLQHFDLRFEPRILPVTFSLTPSGNFFMRMVLGYAHNDSSHWKDQTGALALAKKMFLQRYPSVAELGFAHHWHGITGHTISQTPIMGAIGEGNVHVSVAYNGLGIMPSHNNGYLTACKLVGQDEQDVSILNTVGKQTQIPAGYYRSLLFKPSFRSLIPD